MEPKIVNKDKFYVVGVRYYGANQHDEIGQLWQEFDQQRSRITHGDQSIAYGLCFPVENEEDNEFEYVAGIQVPNLDSIPAGMVGRKIEASRYAVFTHEGTLDKLLVTHRWIMNTYFPKSAYQPRKAPDFEYYDAKFKGKDNLESKLDLYYPIA